MGGEHYLPTVTILQHLVLDHVDLRSAEGFYMASVADYMHMQTEILNMLDIRIKFPLTLMLDGLAVFAAGAVLRFSQSRRKDRACGRAVPQLVTAPSVC